MALVFLQIVQKTIFLRIHNFILIWDFDEKSWIVHFYTHQSFRIENIYLLTLNLFWCIIGGLCALGGIFILTLPIPIVVNSFASYYKNRLWRNEVAYKKRQRAKKRREMELLMRDNLLNILTVPGTYIYIFIVF